jgi:hypothetical protein
MPTERRRHQLYEEAKEVLSVESADELMSYLPPVGWADVATRSDLGMVRNEMDALRAEMRGGIAELGAKIDGLGDRLDSKIDRVETTLTGKIDRVETTLAGQIGIVDIKLDAIETKVDGKIDGLAGQIDGDIARAVDKMRVWTITVVLSLTVGIGGLMFGAAHLGR